MKRTCLLLGLAILTLHAQTPRAFDVATVKLAAGRGAPGRRIREDPARLTTSGVTLRALIEHAYGIENYQLTGGPAWLGSEFYNVEAAVDTPASPTDMRSMLQALLADRFHLVLRREMRDTPVYVLLPAKGGIKPRDRTGAAAQDAVQSQPGRMRFKDLQSLASFMSGFVDRPVLDGSGLKGDYDIVLDVPRPRAAGEASGPPDLAAAMAEFSESLRHMVQDQLGLKAESRKQPMEMLVVERAEKPTPPAQ
jgi:uncharacterized protein (TIGR03435 family)